MKPYTQNNFNPKIKILFLFPAPSSEGGMTITTEMYYQAGVFNDPFIKHFNTSFSWGNWLFTRCIESGFLKLKFIWFLLNYKPNAVFVIASPYWGYYDKIMYCLIAKILGVKSFFNNVSGGFIRFYEGNKINRWLIDKTIGIPDHIILGSPYWNKYFKERFPNISTVEIANPIITSDFIKPKKLNSEKINIVSAFRITKEKGTHELVDVIRGVCDQSSSFTFTIIGDGPEFKHMKSELDKYEREGKVKIKGFMEGSSKNQEIIDADLYLMLTHFDMMPISILEAMSASLAVVSTKVGGIPDMIEDQVSGFLFEINETKPVIKKILELEHQKDLLKKMGAINHTVATNRYELTKIVQKQISYMESKVVSTKSPKSKSNFYKLFLEQLVFKIGDILLSTSFIRELKKNRKYQYFEEEQLNNVQNEKLQKIIKYAVKHSKYYKDIKSQIIINTENIVSTLKQFPILSKEILRNNLDNIVTMNKKDLIVYETSGSSGKATKVYLTKAEESICRAILINWWEWCGYYLGKPYLQTGMTTKRGMVKTLKDWFTRTHYMDAFNLTDDEIVQHLNKIQNKGYHFGGYASSLYVIAQVAEQRKLDITFDGVISWGDKMFPHYKEKIERVFKTKVYENYACNEGIMVGQKVDLPYFYIYTPNVYLELLDENGNEVPDGEIGRVIITKLDGYATPLIRYETGDLAIKLPRNEYPENRKYNFPLLKMVIGRDTDIIKTPEGNRLIVHTFTGIFEFYPSIKQFRVIQNVVDEIEIEYIKTADFNLSTLNNIEKDLRDKTKTNIKINWKEVDFIPNTKSGKPQLIQNNLIKKHIVEQ